MRRKDREVTDRNAIISIIDECEIIRLGLADGDFPYIVPVNFGYTATDDEIAFYIHGAIAGRKYEMLKNNPNCSFEMDLPLLLECLVEEKDATMRYKSVMGKCTAEQLEGEEKQNAIDNIIMARYDETRNFEYNRDVVERTAIFKLTVTEITAKVNPLRGGADL